MIDTIGIVHGRFQMLHNGHMEYLLAGKAKCKYLLIGITNPDTFTTKYCEANPHRSTCISNPLTYYERFEMIIGSMLEAGVSRSEFDVVPFPINYPERLSNYIPQNAKHYMTIYDQWSLEKLSILRELGGDVEILWERTNDQKITSGSEIREHIQNDQSWEHLVPSYVYRYIIGNGLEERIKQLYLEEDK